ncbi:MAG: hypothetical protein OEZ43_07820 [Gammaproteobacteria bacterium]|nr:hypothetical protein [Gammaproteobacteria bacterium]
MYKNILELWGGKTIPEVAIVEHMATQEIGFSVKIVSGFFYGLVRRI